MMNIGNREQMKCRTCLDTTEEKFHSLYGKLVKDDQRQSLADFLWQIAKMENVSETAKKLPQQICDSCLRKLKITFSFVMQVQKINGAHSAFSGSDQGYKNIKEAGTKGVENIDLECGHSNLSQCFINCNDTSDECHEDPIAISQSKKRKRTKTPDNCYERQCNDERSDDSTKPFEEAKGESKINHHHCKNECHEEMKSMLHDLMRTQKQFNERVKGVVLYTDFELSNPNENIVQIKTVEENAGTPEPINETTVDNVLRESVRSWFPISTIDEAFEVERKIQCEGYERDVIALLEDMGYSVGGILRFVFKDDLIQQFNLDGRTGKMSLIKFDSILKCVHTVCSHLPSSEFFKLVRKYVEMSHIRNKQKRRILRKKERYSQQMQTNDLEDKISVWHENEIEMINESEQIYNEIIEENSCTSDAQFNDDASVINILKASTEYEQCVGQMKTSIEASSSENSFKEIKCLPMKLADSPTIAKSCNDSGLPKTTAADNEDEEMRKLFLISVFPITAQEKLLELEKKLKDAEYADRVNEDLIVLKQYKGEVDQVLRCMFSDALIANYNFNGHHGKHSLNGLRLVSHCLYNVYPEITMMEFSKDVRKFIAMSHNRTKNRKRSR